MKRKPVAISKFFIRSGAPFLVIKYLYTYAYICVLKATCFNPNYHHLMTSSARGAYIFADCSITININVVDLICLHHESLVYYFAL